jgi:hypothetical protein
LFALGADEPYLGYGDLAVQTVLALDVGNAAVKISSDGGNLFAGVKAFSPNKNETRLEPRQALVWMASAIF